MPDVILTLIGLLGLVSVIVLMLAYPTTWVVTVAIMTGNYRKVRKEQEGTCGRLSLMR